MHAFKSFVDHVSEPDRQDIIELLWHINRAPTATQARLRARFRVLLSGHAIGTDDLLEEVRRALTELGAAREHNGNGRHYNGSRL